MSQIDHLGEFVTVGNSPLPLRPRPGADELAHGYLARVALSNGYETTVQLWSALRQKDMHTQDALSMALLLTEEEWSNLSGPWPRYCDYQDNLKAGLSRVDYVHGLYRWCPMCLATMPYLRSTWSIKFCVTCLTHETYLIDTCPGCHRRQKIDQFSKLRCACGQSLVACQTLSAPEDVMSLQKALLTVSGSHATSTFSQLTTGRWIQFLQRVAALLEPNRKGHTGQVPGLHQLSKSVVVIQQATQMLANWPEGFHTFLAEIQGKCDVSFSLPRTFGRLYRWLYVDLADQEFAFLRDGFETYLHRHWWGLVCRRNRRLIPTMSEGQRTTVREAAKLAGTSPARVKQLHLAGMIEATTVEHASGRHSWSLPSSAVEDLAGLVGDGMTLKDASQFLALPKHRVRELIQTGIIHPRLSAGSHSSSTWLLSRDELNRLKCTEAHCEASDIANSNGLNTVTLLQVLKGWRLAPGAFPALVAALSAGELVESNPRPSDVPLGKMQISVTNLRAWLERWKKTHLKEMSITVAARTLGIKEQVAYALVRSNLLQAHVSPRTHSYQISHSAILEFQSTYVAATEVAQALGTSPKALLSQISIQPVSGPTINDCRQYFFKRSDIESLLNRASRKQPQSPSRNDQAGKENTS